MSLVIKLFAIVIVLTLAILGIIYVLGLADVEQIKEMVWKSLLVEGIVFVAMLVVKMISKGN